MLNLINFTRFSPANLNTVWGGGSGPWVIAQGKYGSSRMRADSMIAKTFLFGDGQNAYPRVFLTFKDGS